MRHHDRQRRFQLVAAMTCAFIIAAGISRVAWFLLPAIAAFCVAWDQA